MAKTKLEERVATLEAQLSQLQKDVHGSQAVSRDDWKLAIEKYAGDPDLQVVFTEAKKLRVADRKRVKSRRGKGGTGK